MQWRLLGRLSMELAFNVSETVSSGYGNRGSLRIAVCWLHSSTADLSEKTSLLTIATGASFPSVIKRCCRYGDYIVEMIGWLINMEHLVEWELRGETEILGENLPLCQFVHHRSHHGSFKSNVFNEYNNLQNDLYFYSQDTFKSTALVCICKCKIYEQLHITSNYFFTDQSQFTVKRFLMTYNYTL
jgi:hypothetical protein